MKRSRWQPQAIHDPNLVLYLPLRHMEARATQDRSAHGHTVTPSGCTWGKLGYNFDGTDDFINCGNPTALQLTGMLTLMVWIRTTAAANWQRFIAKDDEVNRCYILILKNTGVIRFSFWIGNAEKLLDGTKVINDGNWHHIVGTYNGANQFLYVDGESDATPSAVTGNIDNDAVNFNVGRSVLPGSYYSGLIDGIEIYNRAFAPPEIKRKYLAERILYTG